MSLGAYIGLPENSSTSEHAQLMESAGAMPPTQFEKPSCSKPALTS